MAPLFALLLTSGVGAVFKPLIVAVGTAVACGEEDDWAGVVAGVAVPIGVGDCVGAGETVGSGVGVGVAVGLAVAVGDGVAVGSGEADESDCVIARARIAKMKSDFFICEFN